MWMIWTLEKFIPLNHHSSKDKIFGWHYRLGHPSFSYLQHLFPTLFKNVLLSSFKCKDCILVKVIEQITPSVIINAMHHLRLFTLTYEVLHLLWLLMALDGLSPLLMTVQGSLRFMCWNIIKMSYQFFRNLSPLYKLSSLWALKLFNLIMKANILVKSLDNFIIGRASYTRLLVHILLSRIELPNRKIDTYYRQDVPQWELPIYPNNTGLMSWIHLFIFSTACHPEYLIFTHHSKLWNGILNYLQHSIYLQRYLAVLYLYVFQRTNNPSWINMLFAMSFLAMVLIWKNTGVIIPLHRNSMLLWM